MKFWYCVKNWTGDEFDNEYRPRYEWRVRNDHESVAEDIAEDHFNHEPCDPCTFEPVIGVKDEAGIIKWFQISAEPRVDFKAHQIETDRK